MENTVLYESARKATFLLRQPKSYNLTRSVGNGTVVGDNRMRMFQPVRAHWQLTVACCLQ
jgi:hypothetical protein